MKTDCIGLGVRTCDWIENEGKRSGGKPWRACIPSADLLALSVGGKQMGELVKLICNQATQK